MTRTQAPASRQGPARPVLLAGLAALALALLAVLVVWNRAESPAVAPNAGAAGRLVAAQSTVNLGQVPFNQVAEARYELVNSGAAPVRLAGPPAVETLEGC